MQQAIAILFGLGLVVNGLLFLLQAIGILHGIYQHDRSLILGMSASFLLCGAVTAQAILYRLRAK